MQLVYYISVGMLGLLAGYSLAKSLRKKNQNRVVLKAKISRISLKQIGNIWSPELFVSYSFMFNNEAYTGEDFTRIDQLLPECQILLLDRNGYPVLWTEFGEFCGEEHIETFILENTKEILIEFNSHNLPVSRIFQANRDNDKTLFQNIDIQFPWT